MAERRESHSPTRDGCAAKKVELRDKAFDEPPPTTTKPSYSQAVQGLAEDGVEVNWPSEDEVDYEEGNVVLLPGKYGTGIELSHSFKNRLDKQWANAVVIKLLGKRIGYKLLKERLRALWKPKGPMKIVDLDYEFFLVNFIEHDDYITALTQGPWIILGQVLSVQSWNPNFRPSTGQVTKAVAWVRFSELPISRYHPSILRALGNLVGQTIRMDDTTLKSQRGLFARVAVEVDISQRLKSIVEIDGEEFKVAYEGLPEICYACGVVGHNVEFCVRTVHQQSTPEASHQGEKVAAVNGTVEEPRRSVTEPYGPWIQVQPRKC